jgi:hypothetical protein
MTNTKEFTLVSDDNVKLAAAQDYVHVAKTSDGPSPKFTVVISWFDQKRKGPKSTTLNNVAESKLMTVLKNIGYDYAKASEIIHRADKGEDVNTDILPGMTPWVVRPELSVGGAVKKTVSNIKESLFSADNATKALGHISGGLLAGSGMIGDSLANLSAFAAESAAVADKLEKLAMTKHNDTLTKLAGIMVIKHRVDSLMRDALSGHELTGHEVLADLHKLTPGMEKLARDLIELKLAQTINRNEIVSPNIINATLRNMDGLHKYAQYFKTAGVLGASADVRRGNAKQELDMVRSHVAEPMKPLIQPTGKELVAGAAKVSDVVSSPVGTVGFMAAPMIAKRLKR